MGREATRAVSGGRPSVAEALRAHRNRGENEASCLMNRISLGKAVGKGIRVLGFTGEGRGLVEGGQCAQGVEETDSTGWVLSR